MHLSSLRSLSLALPVLLLAACGGSPDVTLTSVVVSPDSVTVTKGLPATVSATGHYSDGSTASVTATAAWASSDEAVVTVAGGVLTTTGVGTATVTATGPGSVAAGTVSVTVTPATVVSLAVSPTGVTFAYYDAPPVITAPGTLTDATVADQAATVTWTSSDEAIATVSGGVVTPVAPGTVTITATDPGSSQAASATVTISDVAIRGAMYGLLSCSGGCPVPYSTSYEVQILTTLAGWVTPPVGVLAWSTSAPGVATVAQDGVATFVAYGSVTVFARLPSGVTAQMDSSISP